jgi:hypothetical protein
LSTIAKKEARRRAFEELKKLGVYALADEKIEARLEAQKTLQDVLKVFNISEGVEKTPEERLKELVKAMQEVDNILMNVSIPYGRGGSSKWYAQIVKGWSKIYSAVSVIANTVGNLMEEYEEKIQQLKNKSPPVASAYERRKRVLIRGLEHLLIITIVRNAKIIHGISWSAIDVAPSWSTTIQSIPLMGGTQAPRREDRLSTDMYAEAIRQQQLFMQSVTNELKKLREELKQG